MTLINQQELGAFHGLPVVDTGRKGVGETVSDVIALARNPEVLALISMLALRKLSPDDVTSLAKHRTVIPGVDYTQRLEQIFTLECGETSIFTPEDIRSQCCSDPGLIHALVNQYDNLHDEKDPLRLRLVVEGESKQIYKVETPLTRYFDDHVLVLLKPTIYPHSKQATGEIAGLSAIRATGSRLFLEMLHRAGLSHTYEGLNRHGLIWAHSTEITQVETVYKELCLGTDKHSFFGIANDSRVTLPIGQYKRGPYIRFDWRNPNHTYKGVNPATPPIYHLTEVSVGKAVFYNDYLTARAKPFGDTCVPEELVHGVQAVEVSVDCTIRIFFTIQHYLDQIGLEVQDGCVMLDPTGRTMWSKINQDCMRIKRRETTSTSMNGQDAFDKDVWRAGGSSVKGTILDKWRQLNGLLSAHLAGHPFHVMDNFPIIARLVISEPDMKISLALINRRGQHIEPREWTADHPARIAAEHPRMVQTHLAGLGIPHDTFKIQRVLGASESYLVNDPCETYLLCDAVVQTGSTLDANHLEVWQVIKNKGDIVVGLYERL